MKHALRPNIGDRVIFTRPGATRGTVGKISHVSTPLKWVQIDDDGVVFSVRSDELVTIKPGHHIIPPAHND